jgi:peptidyl-tRNA hydrolase, PTH1 family
MKLLVGLGNPGNEYARHRHNVGFMAVDAIAERHRFSPWKKRFQGHACDGEIDGERTLLLKPATYMNDSGRAVGEALRFLKAEIADLVVFHDELDIDPGRLKVKTGGGNAGHNGLRSISQCVGNDFVRVRIGIGHPGHKDAVSGCTTSPSPTGSGSIRCLRHWLKMQGFSRQVSQMRSPKP